MLEFATGGRRGEPPTGLGVAGVSSELPSSDFADEGLIVQAAAIDALGRPFPAVRRSIHTAQRAMQLGLAGSHSIAATCTTWSAPPRLSPCRRGSLSFSSASVRLSAFLALFAKILARLAVQLLRVGLGRTFLGLGFLGHIVGGHGFRHGRRLRRGGHCWSSGRGHLRVAGLTEGKNESSSEHQAGKGFHWHPSLGLCFDMPGTFTLPGAFLKGRNARLVLLPRGGVENCFTYKYICILLAPVIFQEHHARAHSFRCHSHRGGGGRGIHPFAAARPCHRGRDHGERACHDSRPIAAALLPPSQTPRRSWACRAPSR